MPFEQIVQKSPILNTETKKAWIQKSKKMSFIKKQKFAEILQAQEQALGIKY